MLGFHKKTWKSKLGLHEECTQADVVDFNLAVTLVAPWEEYVLDLSPDFQVKTGEDALKHVLPTTGTLEEKIINSFGASANVNVDVGALGLLKGSAEEDTAQDSEEHSHSEHKKAETKKHEGDASKESVPSKQAPAGKPSEGAGRDPMLEYAAATAFFQEVKFLNRYVADAALRRGYRAYVVRLQMSVVPYVRHTPLDVYTNISFFPRREKLELSTPGSVPQPAAAQAIPYPAEVIPLLVTDNLENTIKSRSLDSIKNLALTLSFLHPGVGGGGTLESKHKDFAHALGGDLNSLLTVGRVNDNTLQVRLGAVKDIACPLEYAMLPRTHNVTILLMVPAQFLDDEQDTVCRITAVSKTLVREAKTGKPLNPQSEAQRRKLVEDLVSAQIQAPNTAQVAEDLLRSVYRNDLGHFEKILKKARHNVDTLKYTNPLDLWCKIVETFGRSDFAAVRFELPPDATLPSDKSVLAVDDGTHTTIRLQGGSGLNQNGVSVTLFVKVEGGEIPLVPISEPPGNEVSIMAGGHGMTIKFPSLAAWNIVKLPAKGDGGGPPETPKPIRLEGAKLRLRYAEGRKWGPEAEEDKNEKTCKEIFYVKVKPVEPRDARQRHQIHTEAQAPAGEAPNEPGDQRRTQREKSVKGTDTPRPT